MEEILAAPRPYNLLPEVADLTHTARSVNDQLVSEARGPALAAIQGLLDGVTGELDEVSAGEVLRKAATGELAKLLGTATKATSIAHITQARQTADGAYDRALSAIEKSQIPPPPPPGGRVPVTPPTPKVKMRRVLEVKALWSGDFIETEADVEAFLKKLRTELEAAIKADERVQIK